MISPGCIHLASRTVHKPQALSPAVFSHAAMPMPKTLMKRLDLIHVAMVTLIQASYQSDNTQVQRHVVALKAKVRGYETKTHATGSPHDTIMVEVGGCAC